MWQIFVRRARARNAIKRGGGPQRVTLDDANAANVEAAYVGAGFSRPESAGDIDVLALDEALSRLAALDAELAKVVELRYFGGLTVEEVAEIMHTSPATVKRQWALARAWLKRALDGDVSERTAEPS
jgi:RNA polymerase sigma-70 factor, ECF subfamily